MRSKRWPRFCELGDFESPVLSPDSYFHDFEKVIGKRSLENFYDRLEKELQGLDPDAWKSLKNEASPYVCRKDLNGRGWSQLFDILYQARAYNYLTREGYSEVRFIERSRRQGIETPDLAAQSDSIPVLCEVKTINASETEIQNGRDGGARDIPTQLNEKFRRKLFSTIEKAEGQLRAHPVSGPARNFIYVNISFDEYVGYYQEYYYRQIEEWLLANPLEEIDLVLHNNQDNFDRNLSMKAATLVNDR